MYVGDAAALLDLLHRRIVVGIAQVLKNGPVEEIGLLSDHTYLRPQIREIKVADINTRYPYRAGINVVQPRDEIDDGRLAGA